MSVAGSNISKFSLTPVLVVSALLCALFLSACVTIPPKSKANTAQSADQVNPAESDTPIEPELKLPNMELNAELLEQLLVANLASYRGEWEVAVKNATASAISSKDPRVAQLATLLALRIKDYKSAAATALIWTELLPDDQEANGTLLLAQVGAGMVEQAKQGFNNRRGEKSLDDHIKEVAGLLVRQSNAAAALELAKHYVAEHADSAQVLLSSAYVAESFDSIELAEQWINRALEYKPGWDLAAQMKTSMLRRQGKTEELSAYIKEFVSNYPESVNMRINYAAEQAREELFEDALLTMQGVIVDEPQNIGALNYAAALAQQLKQEDLAHQYQQQAIKIDPENEEVRWALARRAEGQKNYLEAERHYQKIDSTEHYLRAQLQVANMRFHTRSLKEAINTLRLLDPETEAEYVDIAITRHWLLMQGREYEEALGSINETLIYLPENTELKYARALVAAELKEVATAEADLRFIIKLQPDHANALNALGYTLADQTDRLDEAKELIVKALELRPEDAHILDSMGWVLYRQKDFDGAIEILRRAFENSDEVEIATHLGEVLWESGQQEEANKVWQEAIMLDAENLLLKETLQRYGIKPNA